MQDGTRGLTIDDAVLLLTRVVTLGMGAVAAIAIGGLEPVAVPVVLLALVAATASIVSRTRLSGPWMPVAEALLAGAIIGLGPDQASTLLPYLIAPSVAAGLAHGAVWAGLATFAGGLALAGAGNVREAASSAQWFAIVLGSGLLAAWVRRTRRHAAPVSEQRAYRESAVLLAELRTLTRPLSAGLDPRSLGAGLIAELAAVEPLRDATVLLSIGSDRRPVAEIRGSSPVASGADVISETVIPLVLDNEAIAWVVIRDPADIEPSAMRQLEAVASSWSLSLEAAALFEEVRELATRDERARLARDLHDGLAQDVASLGLLADDLLHQAPSERHDDLVLLRDRIGQLVSELRLSIHDLRDEGTTTGGLSATIGEAARREAGAAGLAVHLRMADAPTLLRTDVETEIFRIAQEALTNVGKHARASNLWVSSQTGPGGVLVSISDDGVGMASARSGRLGMKIMAERASRIGAELSIRPRDGGGTIVELQFVPAMATERGVRP